MLSTHYFKNTQISNFVKLSPVRTKLFYAKRRADISKLIVAFRTFVNGPKMDYMSHIFSIISCLGATWCSHLALNLCQTTKLNACKETAAGAFRDFIKEFSYFQSIVLFSRHTCSRYTCKCTLSCTRADSMVFPAHIFRILTSY